MIYYFTEFYTATVSQSDYSKTGIRYAFAYLQFLRHQISSSHLRYLIFFNHIIFFRWDTCLNFVVSHFWDTTSVRQASKISAIISLPCLSLLTLTSHRDHSKLLQLSLWFIQFKSWKFCCRFQNLPDSGYWRFCSSCHFRFHFYKHCKHCLQ